MLKFRFMMAAALVAVLTPFTAEAQNTLDCSNPQTQTAMNICAAQDYKTADAELNRVYQTAIRTVRATDAELPPELKGAEAALRGAQRAWIPFRDRSCEVEGFEARGGTMESLLVSTCLAHMTRKRTQELKDIAAGTAN